MHSEKIKINSLDIYYRVGGDKSKPIVVWLDGLSISKDLNGRLEKTGRFLSYFLEDFRVYSLEYASFMRSSVPKDEWNINNYVDLIHEFLKIAKIEKPFILMGHSFGGLLAYAYCAKYGDELKLLVVSDPPVTYKLTPFYLKMFTFLEKSIDFIFDSKLVPTTVKKMVPKYFMSTSDQNLQKYSPQEFKVAIKSFIHIASFDNLSMAKNILTRTILISGTKDFLVPNKNTMVVKDSIKNCELFSYKEGHTTLPWRMAELRRRLL